jgi:hypothetical protein
MRIILSQGKVNIFKLAKNAGTSVNQIERFYAGEEFAELWGGVRMRNHHANACETTAGELPDTVSGDERSRLRDLLNSKLLQAFSSVLIRDI